MVTRVLATNEVSDRRRFRQQVDDVPINNEASVVTSSILRFSGLAFGSARRSSLYARARVHERVRALRVIAL